MESTDNRFDIILIGSGMGALASASILAQVQKRRVLVLNAIGRLAGLLTFSGEANMNGMSVSTTLVKCMKGASIGMFSITLHRVKSDGTKCRTSMTSSSIPI